MFLRSKHCLFTPLYFFCIMLPESLPLFVDTACMHVAVAVVGATGENREKHISSLSFFFVDFLIAALQRIGIFGPVKILSAF